MNISSIKSDNVITLISPSLKSISLKVNEIVNAEVLEVMDSGRISLRLKTGNEQRGFIILAKTEIPLSKGDNLFLRVMDVRDVITLQFAGFARQGNMDATNNISAKIYNMLSELADSRLRTDEIISIKKILSSLPEAIKKAITELKGIDRILTEIENINQKILKDSIENSGVLFETRLKLLRSGDQKIIEQIVMSDLKGLLLKIKDKLNDESILKNIQLSEFGLTEIKNSLNRLIKNIEFFQFNSLLNDVLYTFLPLSWQALIDGEILFRKNIDNKGGSFTCEIRLDLESMGKLSVLVTLFGKDFYITFNVEKTETISLLISNKGLLEERFTAAGLKLNAINISQKKRIDFGPTIKGDLNIIV